MSTSAKRTILITGCSTGGAGHALALEFAAKGLRVFATARSTKSLATLEAKGIEVLPLEVTSAESIQALKEEITKRTGGKLDMLFNNAGFMYEHPAVEADPALIRKMFDANVFGVFDMINAFFPLLLAAAGNPNAPPTIINTASVLSRLPYIFSSGYNASKAAVVSYSDTLRLELQPFGIKVVTLLMGEVSTGLMSENNISFGQDSLYIDAQEGVKERTRQHIQKSMGPEVFASQVVNSVLSKPALGKGEFVWKGTNAGVAWLLNAVGPRKVFDPIAKSGVGLNKEATRKAILERGQHRVKRD
ncbi:NAD(P)-binding protein [Cadophora sp. DSE1049]|nr:NAD(P)-binding protein [Cadophora sp. DSE1049]